MLKKEAKLTNLHEEKCLIKYFGNSTLLPSMNRIIEKRDDAMEFGEKVLALNNRISLSSFKEIIYRFLSIKKCSLYIGNQKIVLIEWKKNFRKILEFRKSTYEFRRVQKKFFKIIFWNS